MGILIQGKREMSYYYNLLKCLYNYHNKEVELDNYPLVQDIEVTNVCNLRCPFCARDNIEKRGLGFMSRNTFQNIVNSDNKRMLRHIRLFGHGEPLLNEDINYFVRESKLFAKTVGFSTNGLLLTKRLSERLIDSGLTTISISFEGINKEIYEQLRKGSNYEKVLVNINDLLDVRKEMDSNLYISMAIIDCKETNNYLKDFVSYWSMKGINNVEVLKLHDWGGILDWQNSKDLDYRNEVCLWAWYGLGVYWNGDITPCCVYESDAENLLGNVNYGNINDIWNSYKYRSFRIRQMSNRKGLRICETCRLASLTFGESYLKVSKQSNYELIKNYYKLMLIGLNKVF